MDDETSKETEKKAPEKTFAATAELRWFHPAGQVATGRTLQQLWADGESKEWRDVPVFNEE